MDFGYFMKMEKLSLTIAKKYIGYGSGLPNKRSVANNFALI